MWRHSGPNFASGCARVIASSTGSSKRRLGEGQGEDVATNLTTSLKPPHGCCIDESKQAGQTKLMIVEMLVSHPTTPRPNSNEVASVLAGPPAGQSQADVERHEVMSRILLEAVAEVCAAHEIKQHH